MLDSTDNMPKITHIYGLVTRSSSDKRSRSKPLRCAGLYKTEGACVSSPEVVTKPSPYTLGAFCLAITKTPQSGLANGPTWAALKKHRMPRKGELKRLGACRGPVLEVNQPIARTNRKRLEVGTQGRACGVRQPLLNRQVSIKSFWYQVNESKISRGGFKPTPALGDL